jgi:hypothetical protein
MNFFAINILFLIVLKIIVGYGWSGSPEALEIGEGRKRAVIGDAIQGAERGAKPPQSRSATLRRTSRAIIARLVAGFVDTGANVGTFIWRR